MSEILAVAREQVLERGEGLDRDQTLRVLQLPDDRLDDLLALAHEVRMAWCGPDVEVEGKVSFIDPVADRASETVKVDVIIENPERVLLAGVRCRLQFGEEGAGD